MLMLLTGVCEKGAVCDKLRCEDGCWIEYI